MATKVGTRQSSLYGEVPGGRWDDRSYSFWKQTKELFKKQFKLKVRKTSSIIELLIAFLFYLVLYPLDDIAKVVHGDTLEFPINETYFTIKSYFPQVDINLTTSMELYQYIYVSNTSRVIFVPDNNRTKKMADIFSKLILSSNQTTVEPELMNDLQKMKNIVETQEYSGVGFHWRNSDKDDAYISPDIDIYCQGLLSCPKDALLTFIKLFLLEEANNGMNKTELYNLKTNYKNFEKFGINSKFYSQRYPRQKSDSNYDMNYVFMIFIIVPIVLSTMPDFETVLDEKDSRIAAFGFMNGCSETAYWLVNIVTPFVFSIIPYIASSLCFCYWYRMVGTDFSYLLVVDILFVLSHILFQYWLSTFMKSGTHGRFFIIIFLVLDLFFGFLHAYVSFDSSQRGGAIQHILSIIPFSCYQMTIGTLYENGIGHQRHLGWNTLYDDAIPYPLWMGVMWLAIDCVLYFILFVICNACNTRVFGTPFIKWRDIFKPSAWKNALRHYKFSGEQTNGHLLSVEKLDKTYKGGKEVEVFNDAKFYVKKNEVIVIIGPNGAGKSTLINMLAGAIEPDHASVVFGGYPEMNRFKPLQESLGVVFQENIIYTRLSVREHLHLFGAYKGISDENLKESIEFYADNMQMTEMLDNFAGDLSGGQKRKLCIMMALLGNPPIVLMDEPTAGVDVQARQLIWKTIASLKDTTSIVTSHTLEEAETVSSRLFIVSDKCIPFCGTSTELRNLYHCGYVLRVERDDGTVGDVLKVIQKSIPTATLSDDRHDCIRMPVDKSIAGVLRELHDRREELGIRSVSFNVEQLEDMLMKMIETGETLARRESSQDDLVLPDQENKKIEESSSSFSPKHQSHTENSLEAAESKSSPVASQDNCTTNPEESKPEPEPEPTPKGEEDSVPKQEESKPEGEKNESSSSDISMSNDDDISSSLTLSGNYGSSTLS